MSHDIGPLLHRAVQGIHPDPALAYRAIQGGRRSRRRRRVTAAAAALAVAAVGTAGTAQLVSHSHEQNAVISAAAPPASTAPAPDPLAGPDGPAGSPGPGRFGFPASERLYGRAYPVAAVTTTDGRRLTEVAYWTSWSNDPRPGTIRMCLAHWQPGAALSSAVTDACPFSNDPHSTTLTLRASAANDRSGAWVVTATQRTGLATADGRQVIAVPRQAARAELLYALTADIPATATPDGGRPPIRLRLPITLHGADQPAQPLLTGTADPVPAGYDQIGINLWDAGGTLIHHELYGYYCGPDPKNGKTYLVCPANPGG